jgi:hypothetical protein
MSAKAEIPVAPLPTFSIDPPSSWTSIGFRELWDYRELLYFLIWRDVKVRYKQTALGAAWAIIQPVFMMLGLVCLLAVCRRSCLSHCSTTRHSEILSGV